MKRFFQKASSLIAVLAAAAALAGCAANQTQPKTGDEHKEHHPAGAAAQPSGGMGMMGQGGGGQMGMMGQRGAGQMGMMGQDGTGQMDMKSMCEMHGRMKNARTPEERGAMMDERMKGMSPEMRQRHMEMMQQQCK